MPHYRLLCRVLTDHVVSLGCFAQAGEMSVAVDRMLRQFTVRAGRAAFLAVPVDVVRRGALLGAGDAERISRPELKSQTLPSRGGRCFGPAGEVGRGARLCLIGPYAYGAPGLSAGVSHRLGCAGAGTPWRCSVCSARAAPGCMRIQVRWGCFRLA